MLGQKVEPGQLLFKLDTSVEERRLQTARARLDALKPQLEVTGAELTALLDAIKTESAMGLFAAQEARAIGREARVRAQLAQSEAKRFGQLSGDIPDIEVERAKANAEIRKASSEASSLAVRRLLGDRATRLKNGEVRAAGLRRELAVQMGEQQALLATVAELEQIIARRQIRAPRRGQIGELLPLNPGAYIAEGARLATLMPLGELILVAEFEPADALGRIKPEQPAQLRLSGFPWLEFGVVRARVARVARELQAGTIRVEMELLEDSQSLIPIQHGQPGSVEVEVERVTPAELLLRSLGSRLARKSG
jgi:multidrug resistance efflux pump